MQSPLMIGIAILGIVLMAGSFFIFEVFDGNWLFYLGYALLLVALILPLKFKDYVKAQKGIVTFKIGKNKTQIIRLKNLKSVEVFKEIMFINK